MSLADLHKHIFVVHFFEQLRFLNPCPPTKESVFTTSRTLIYHFAHTYLPLHAHLFTTSRTFIYHFAHTYLPLHAHLFTTSRTLIYHFTHTYFLRTNSSMLKKCSLRKVNLFLVYSAFSLPNLVGGS